MAESAPAVAGYLARWGPPSVSPAAAAFARDVVARAGPGRRARAKSLLYAAARLADWAPGLGLELAPAIEAMLPAGVRRRQLKVRTLAIGMLLAMAGRRPAHLTEARGALAGLPADDQARLGVTGDWHGRRGPCRQGDQQGLGGLADRAAAAAS
jgi:hypothetical protein